MNKQKVKAIAIYHVVFKRENFGDAVKALVKCVWEAQQKFPNQPRHLYLDIDGHRNKDGGLDSDMWELVSEFILDINDRNPIKGGFKTFFTKWSVPGPDCSMSGTNETQNNDPPERIEIKAA